MFSVSGLFLPQNNFLCYKVTKYYLKILNWNKIGNTTSLLASAFPEREQKYLFLSCFFNYHVQDPVKFFALLTMCLVLFPREKYIFQKLLRNTIVFRRPHYFWFWSICVIFRCILSGLIKQVDTCKTWSNFTWSELLHLTCHHVTLEVKLNTMTNKQKLYTVLKYFKKKELFKAR